MKKTCLSLLLFLLTLSSFAHSYFVKSEQEFLLAIHKLLPGDEVIIANGSYTNWNLEIPNEGKKNKPILVRAEEVGGVIFSGDVSKPIFVFSGAHVILTGITFSNCILNGKSGLVECKNSKAVKIINCNFTKNQTKIQFTPLVVISGNGSGNEINNCSFLSNVDNQDVQVKITAESCPQLTLISNNLFKDKSKVSWKNANGGECVQIGQDPVLLGNKEAHTTVIGNHFVNCNGESEIISNKSSANHYVGNFFENNDGELVMRGGHDCMIIGNTFKGGTGGIRINGTGHRVINNQIDNVKTAIRLMYGMAKGKGEIGFYIAASHCTIKDNQISNATTGILIGDSKNADWTGKFDTKRYPSPVIQNIAPFNNKIEGNKFVNSVGTVVDAK